MSTNEINWTAQQLEDGREYWKALVDTMDAAALFKLEALILNKGAAETIKLTNVTTAPQEAQEVWALAIHYRAYVLEFEKSKEYRAGFDCGFNGTNEVNCHFSNFATPTKTKQWEKGRADGELQRAQIDKGESRPGVTELFVGKKPNTKPW